MNIYMIYFEYLWSQINNIYPFYEQALIFKEWRGGLILKFYI